jgi:hypothetical protein
MPYLRRFFLKALRFGRKAKFFIAAAMFGRGVLTVFGLFPAANDEEGFTSPAAWELIHELEEIGIIRIAFVDLWPLSATESNPLDIDHNVMKKNATDRDAVIFVIARLAKQVAILAVDPSSAGQVADAFTGDQSAALEFATANQVYLSPVYVAGPVVERSFAEALRLRLVTLEQEFWPHRVSVYRFEGGPLCRHSG